MRTILTRLTVLASAALLLACAGNTVAPTVTPVYGSADQAYAVGRQQHLARRHDEAILAYRAALHADPLHLNARNGLAIIHAERGELASAMVLWQAMLGDGSLPGGAAGAFVYNNLGHAQFLTGQFAKAGATLEQACLRDPLNARAWSHLGAALDKLGQHQRARQMRQQAEALLAHDFKADYAVAERAGLAAIERAVLAAPGSSEQWDQTELEQDANGVYVLRRMSAGPAPQVVAPAAPALAGALLEIRNGNGVPGLAKALARGLGEGQLQAVRLSNQKGFGVRQTRVEYQPAYRDAAQRLAERVGAGGVVAMQRGTRVDVRLVIGHDLTRDKAAALSQPSAALAGRAKLPPKAG